MNNLKFLLFAFLLTGLFILASCGGGVDCDDTAGLQSETSRLLNAAITAESAYSADTTDTAACNDYSDALKELIDYTKDAEECVPADELEEYQDNTRSLEGTLDDLEC